MVLSQDIFDAVTDSEKSVPYLRGSGRDAFGRPRGDSLVVTEGWTRLQNFGIENGCAVRFMPTAHEGFKNPDIRVASQRTTMTKTVVNTTEFFKC